MRIEGPITVAQNLGDLGLSLAWRELVRMSRNLDDGGDPNWIGRNKSPK